MSEHWDPDDKTERSPNQKRLDQIREITVQQAATYQTMKILWDQILLRWRHPWKDET